jgi:hypothetical protein
MPRTRRENTRVYRHPASTHKHPGADARGMRCERARDLAPTLLSSPPTLFDFPLPPAFPPIGRSLGEPPPGPRQPQQIEQRLFLG